MKIEPNSTITQEPHAHSSQQEEDEKALHNGPTIRDQESGFNKKDETEETRLLSF